MSYKEFPVGSVVYFLHKEKVLPAQVYEKIVRTSMEGSKSTYLLKVRSKSKAPTQDGFSVIELDPENANVFQTPEEIKGFMVARATEAVTHLVERAVQSSSIFENVVTPATDVPELDLLSPEPVATEDDKAWHVPAAERPLKGSKKEKVEYAEVDLGDGRTARMKI